MVLVPQGQEICILMKNDQERTMDTIFIAVKQIKLKCQKNYEYFTRFYVIETVSTKKCAIVGSCEGDKCEAINVDSKIPKFNGEASNNLGFTYCLESCGCAGCECSFCSSECLFHRNYISSLNEKIYEIFTCPVWLVSVGLLAKIIQQRKTITQKVSLLEKSTVKVQSTSH